MGRGLAQATPRHRINIQINGAELETRSTDADYGDDPGLNWDLRGVSGGPLGRVGWRRAGICCAVGDG